MRKIIKRKKLLTNVFACILFAAGLIGAAVSFWTELGNSLFGNGSQIALGVKLSPLYYVLSCVFAALLVVLVIFAYKLKNKLLVWLPLGYQLLTILSVICFAILASNVNEDTYIITIIMFTLFSPLYGFCELTYIWSLFLILPLFFASIIIAYKVHKFVKEVKLLTSKKKRK